MSTFSIDSFVSIVIVIQDACDASRSTLRNLGDSLGSTFTDYEIVLVDKGTVEGSYRQVASLLPEIKSIRCIQLAFPVSLDVAYAAGMENAIGDFVVLYSPQSDPVNCIVDAVLSCQTGVDIVVGVSKQNQTLGYKLARPCIQFLLRKISYDLPRNASSFRCLTRKAVNCVTQTGRFHHQLYVKISKTGYSTANLNFEALTSSKRTFIDGFKQTMSLLVFNSTAPLRWMSVVGAVGSFLALCFATYSILIRFFKDDVIEGWTSLAFVMSFLFMLLFTILAFFGEYLGRLLDDRSEHRDYSIRGEMNSSVMLETDRLNVTHERISEIGMMYEKE